jgi:two-component system invasion response regulator UvrY
MINLIIVDDHQLIRAGLARMLGDVDGMRVLDQADSGEAALQKIRALRPNVVLMDVRMPGMGGLEATRRALRIDPDLRVIGMSVSEEEPIPSQMLRSGAAGFLSKGASTAELIAAIRRVHVGQRYVSADVARRMALRSFGGDHPNPFELLSGRELQITLMVVNCQKVNHISERLRLSPKTVNSYRYRIFEKLGVTGDVELTLLAVRHGLIDSKPQVEQLAEQHDVT